LRIYFFFSSGKTLTQFLEFYPQEKITFSILFKPLINFQGIKTLLENKKRKMAQMITVLSARPAKQSGPATLRARCRTQAATWAWADKAAPVRSPAWAESGPINRCH